MDRITRKENEGRAAHLAKRTGLDLNIQYAYGKGQLYIGDTRHISPLLSTGQLYDWMSAFETGLDYAPGIGRDR